MFSQAAFPDLLTVLLVRPALHLPLPKALCPPCETGVLLPCGCRACELCPACGIPMAHHVSVSWTITSDHRQLSQRPRVQNQAVCRAALSPKARAGSARLVQRLLADWRFLVSLGLWTHHAHCCLCHRRALLCVCVFTVGLTLLVPGADLTVKPPCRPLTDAQKTGMGQEAGEGQGRGTDLRGFEQVTSPEATTSPPAPAPRGLCLGRQLQRVWLQELLAEC